MVDTAKNGGIKPFLPLQLFFYFFNGNQVADFVDHTPNHRRILDLNRVTNAAEPQ
jgi:hypothetical protein